MKKISVICTVYNEEATIKLLLSSLAKQTCQPFEVIICDGQSTDTTQKIIKDFAAQHPRLQIKLIEKKGNRSVGRNVAISAAQTDLIAITDAGCIPQDNWLEELLRKYEDTDAPVVAGYYKGLPQTSFEEAVVPYALVMPGRINEKTFLPATRSMLLEKEVWEGLGGFDEQLSLNEDYPFAKKIAASGYKIVFAKKAVVGWLPRKNLPEFVTMIARFAQGDAEAKILRPKVAFIFVRYFLLVLTFLIILYYSTWRSAVSFLLVLFVLYSLWAIEKNKKYVKNGWYWLPLLQYTADISVMLGTIKGVAKIILNKK